MKHKVKVTVLDKKVYPELQQQYCFIGMMSVMISGTWG